MFKEVCMLTAQVSGRYLALQTVCMMSCLSLNDSQAWCWFGEEVADHRRAPGAAVRSSCSRSCPSPVSHWWVRWGWTGLQHWWSHGSPLCWPPSYGSLEKMETHRQVIQRTWMNWGCLDTLSELPVRTSLKAASTFVESNADVSMNMRPFFSGLVWRARARTAKITNQQMQTHSRYNMCNTDC